MKVDGLVAVITGGGSGMGRSLAIQLANKGCKIAICDINEQAMNETVELVKERNVQVSSYKIDVSKENEMENFKENVINDFGAVHLLFANAGVQATGRLIYDEKMSKEEIEKEKNTWDRCFNIDYYGVLYSIRAFLPTIIKQKEGYVLVTSSVMGLTTCPSQGSYTAAKFAVRGLTESLICETYAKAPHVHVAVIHPGCINTNIIKNSWTDENGQKLGDIFSKIALLSSDEAASWIIDGIYKNKSRILVGYDSIMVDTMSRMDPHKSFDVFKALGNEGITHWETEKAHLAYDQFRNVSLLGWLRIAYNGGARFGAYLSLVPILHLINKYKITFRVILAVLIIRHYVKK